MAQETAIWEQVAELAKKAALNPALFKAINAARPVAWESDTLVVGLAPEDGQHAGVLNTGDFKLKIEAAVRQVTRAPKATFRVVEGTHVSDWEAAKARDAAGEARRNQAAQSFVAASGPTESWDALYNVLQSLWAEAPFRNFATGRARFIQKAFDVIEEAIPNFGGMDDEANEREFSRTIERVAGMVGSDAAVLAFLLLERKKAA